MQQPRNFSRWVLTVCGPLLVWAGQFLFCYVLASLACARGFSTASVARVPVAQGLTLLATLLAAGVCALLLMRTRRASRVAAGADQFQLSLAIASSVLALIAIAWTGIAALSPLCASS